VVVRIVRGIFNLLLIPISNSNNCQSKSMPTVKRA